MLWLAAGGGFLGGLAFGAIIVVVLLRSALRAPDATGFFSFLSGLL
jgi:hypothetical protein